MRQSSSTALLITAAIAWLGTGPSAARAADGSTVSGRPESLTLAPAATQGPALPTAVDGQPPLPRLTLDDAIAQATANSHRLGELRAREAAAHAFADGRGAAQKPIVITQLGYQRTNHVEEFGFPAPGGISVIYPDVPDNYRARIELQWPIYTGGRLQALERAARAEAEFTGLELATARADLKLEVTRAFWALLTARESVHVLEEALRRVDAQLADVRARFDAGLVPPNDVLSVEAERARQAGFSIEAQNLAAVTEADLARLIGAVVGTAISLDAVLEPPEPAQTGNPATLLTAARAGRTERRGLETRRRAAEERETAALAGRLPAVALVTGVDYARPNPHIFPRVEEWRHSWDVGVNLSWTAWDAGRTRAEVLEAASLTEATRQRLAEFDSTLALEVRQRTLELDSARAQIAAAGEGVRAAAEARRVVQERFAAGVATSTDLLDAQVALLQAEVDRTRALANVRLASARLDRALGR
jgi:outer membrane protein